MTKLLFKRTAAGIYEVNMTFINTTSGGLGQITHGFIDSKRIRYNAAMTLKQFEALVKKKLNEGYKTPESIGCNSLDINYAELDALLPRYIRDQNEFVKIMKCQPFKPDKFDYTPIAFGQPKINGNRVTASWGQIGEGLFKKDGAVLKTHEGHICKVEHIRKIFDEVFKECGKNIVFDGEMYVRNEPVTSISGACRNDKNSINKKLQFHCFDLAIPDVDQINRLTLKDNIFQKMYYPGLIYKQLSSAEHTIGILDKHHIINVMSKQVYNDSDSTEYRDECINAGYEGCVIRNGIATYRFGSRPVIMQKLKKPHYGEFIVVDITTFGFNNINVTDIGKGIKFVLKNDQTNDTFESRCTGTVDQQTKLYNNRKKIIGTKINLRYYERTATKLPFHTTVII